MLSFTEAELADLTAPPQSLAMLLASLLRKRYMGQYAVEAPEVQAHEEHEVIAFV